MNTNKGNEKMFWGIVFIVVGIVLVINYAMGIHLPIFKILFGVLLIYWGLSMIFGSVRWNFSFSRQTRATENEALFSNSKFTLKTEKELNEYNVVFGSGTLDLSLVEIPLGTKIEINTVFGETHLLIKKNLPIKVVSSTAFGKTKLPDRNFNAFGEFTYLTPGIKLDEAQLIVEANTVFGKLIIEEVGY